MKESEIRKKIIDRYEQASCVCWYPAIPKYQMAQDIFSCFDLICICPSGTDLIQLTTTPNFAARKRKVQRFLDANGIDSRRFSEIRFVVAAYNTKKGDFKVEIL